MAGEWMPTRLDLHDDPAVIGIASATELDVDAVVGKLIRFWSWANRHLQNGHARGVTEAWLAQFLNSEKFGNAMCSVGWLTLKSGQLFIPKYDRWNSQSAKRRLLESRRKARSRVPDLSALDADKMRTRVEKSREENTKTRNPSPEAGEPGQIRPKKTRHPSPMDPIFDALAEVSGLDPDTAGGRIGKAASLLYKADPRYTPEEIREFARRFWEFCPHAAEKRRERPTPGEVANHIGLTRAGPAPPQTSRASPRTRAESLTETATSSLKAIMEQTPCPTPSQKPALPG